MKKIILILIIILLISGAGCNNNGIDKELAKCIGENSILYVKEGCSACAKQKEMFGSSFKELNVIDCAFESIKCREAGITAVPTWFINDEYYKGVKSIEKLKELTNC